MPVITHPDFAIDDEAYPEEKLRGLEEAANSKERVNYSRRGFLKAMGAAIGLASVGACHTYAIDAPSVPIVYEEYDSIEIVQIGENSFVQVYFIRDGEVRAQHLFEDGMNWSHNGKKFVLQWKENCEGPVIRIIEANKYSFVQLPKPLPGEEADGDAFWGRMGRNMGTLKMPPIDEQGNRVSIFPPLDVIGSSNDNIEIGK